MLELTIFLIYFGLIYFGWKLFDRQEIGKIVKWDYREGRRGNRDA